jgi:hypothetical protein
MFIMFYKLIPSSHGHIHFIITTSKNSHLSSLWAIQMARETNAWFPEMFQVRELSPDALSTGMCHKLKIEGDQV